MTTHTLAQPVLVIGAGIMGAGIAQIAALAGHPVRLFDAREHAAAEARQRLATSLDTLVAKGRLGADAAAAALARITPIVALQEGADAAIAVEAIVENLEAKRGLLRTLEKLVGEHCILASNTSSIPITALANGLAHPGRVVGMHFFNPVPSMKLVEVISGLRTDEAVADAVFALAARWGKTPVHARSTPGFIVNRIARPYYAEALALLLERAATPEVLDACLRGAGFRMGACELIDLIGHDTNFAVTESVYHANFGDKRYQPSLVQREMVDGGLLGRKSGRGFYEHAAGAPSAPRGAAAAAPAPVPEVQRLVVHGQGALAHRWVQVLGAAGVAFERDGSADWTGLAADGAQLRLTDGRAATQLGAEGGPRELVVHDLPLAVLDPAAPPPAHGAAAPALALAPGALASDGWVARAEAWLAVAGYAPQRIADVPGLVVARTVAMLVNEAADAVHQGVCSTDGADTAMKLGVNYPAGPFEWLARWDAAAIAALLDHLATHYRGERYRVSPWLRQRAWRAAIAARTH